jgi:segregation and condensation protein B
MTDIDIDQDQPTPVDLDAPHGEPAEGEPAEAEPAAPEGEPPAPAISADIAEQDDAAPAAAEESAPDEPLPPEEAGAQEAAAEDADAEEGVALGGEELPDISTDEALDAALESLLLVVDSPAGEDALATALDQPVARVETALGRLAAGYTEQQRGIDLRRAGDGWRFYTRNTYAPFVEKLLTDGQRAKLTRAALETLAVIAYRQPVTRSRVAAVRGVNVDGVIRTLLARGLVEETGADPDTGGTLYRTTELFLERLGLSSLDELPPIAPLLPEVDAIDDV